MIYETQTTQERHEMLSDIPRFSKNVRIVGSANRYNGEDHLVLRLRALPTLKYFLKETDDDPDKFAVFSGKSFQGNSVRFYHVIGMGEKILDEFIKIKIYDLNLIFYIQLKPSDQTLVSPAA